MKVSTKGRYGLRAMIDLVLNSNNEHVSLISIAERQDISKSYLEQVFSALRKSGVVKSVKGAQGGYVLAKSPSEITVGMLLRTLEGDLSVIGKSEEGNEVNPIESCIKQCLWDQIDRKVNEIIEGITLEDLIQEYRKNSDYFMFYI